MSRHDAGDFLGRLIDDPALMDGSSRASPEETLAGSERAKSLIPNMHV